MKSAEAMGCRAHRQRGRGVVPGGEVHKVVEGVLGQEQLQDVLKLLHHVGRAPRLEAALGGGVAHAQAVLVKLACGCEDEAGAGCVTTRRIRRRGCGRPRRPSCSPSLPCRNSLGAVGSQTATLAQSWKSNALHSGGKHSGRSGRSDSLRLVRLGAACTAA